MPDRNNQQHTSEDDTHKRRSNTRKPEPSLSQDSKRNQRESTATSRTSNSKTRSTTNNRSDPDNYRNSERYRQSQARQHRSADHYKSRRDLEERERERKSKARDRNRPAPSHASKTKRIEKPRRQRLKSADTELSEVERPSALQNEYDNPGYTTEAETVAPYSKHQRAASISGFTEVNPEDAVDEQPAQPEDDKMRYREYGSMYNKEQRRWGNLLRTLVVVSNILFWFAGCAILSVAIWLRFIDTEVKNYYVSFQILEITLYVMLAAGVLFLVIALIGTCGANMKNKVLLTLYIASMTIVTISEIIGLLIYIRYQDYIQQEFLNWFKTAFDAFKVSPLSADIVHHVQSTLDCCGNDKGPEQFTEQHGIKPPRTCVRSLNTRGDVIIPDVASRGCKLVLKEASDGYLVAPYITVPILLIIQIAGLASSTM